MSPYYTPIDVARALVKHAPKRLSTLIEPAVGIGDLLEPLRHRLLSCTRIVCIDKDSNALKKLRTNFAVTLGKRLEIIRGNFLEWPTRNINGADEASFQCVLMNPPFDGKKGDFVDIDCAVEMPGVGKGRRRVSIEVAFVLKAVRLLQPGGRLLAVVPSSIVSSLSTRWLREYLLQVGAVKYVHELPRFTFLDLGARVYLFVFEKHERQGSLVLSNHDLAEPDSIQIKKSELHPDLRFDYGFHSARRWLEALKASEKRLQWLPIESVADVLRGEMQSPTGARHAIHTTSYRDGFWGIGDRKGQLKRSTTDRRIMRNDLIVKRVGKNCSWSFGSVTDACGYASSDCVVIIRPHKASEKLKLLFAIRTVLGSEVGPALLERGTGAPYLTVAELPDLEVPVNLADLCKREFSAYQRAVQRRNFTGMLAVENQVRKRKLTVCLDYI